jgi:hypothetical protein
VVDNFQPEDAAGVANLFFSVYGPTYPFDTFYIPEKIAAENARGNIYSVVARTPRGDIIGHGAFYRSSPPFPELFEVGQYLVHPSYRTSFAAFKIQEYLTGPLLSRLPLCGFFGEAVCNHLITQKASHRAGMKDVGLELGLMPPGAYAREGALGRVSCLLMFRSLRDRPQRLYIPALYRPELEALIGDLSLDRELVCQSERIPPGGPSRLDSRFFGSAGVGRASLEHPGSDLERVVAEFETQAQKEEAVVLQLFVNLKEPSALAALEFLRRQGYFLGGYLPRWFDSDALLVQKIKYRPEFEAVQLYSDRARWLLHQVRQDWERTHFS